jgi:hypothetical protein
MAQLMYNATAAAGYERGSRRTSSRPSSERAMSRPATVY